MGSRARVIAYYLPQFYPIPENDEWWGAGFTEWTNVVKARPLFRGHYQPRLPGELGFYDLRVAETRAQQAQLAAQYGVEAFCYYHYWFGGQRVLERPFAEVVQSGEPDFPFCLAWANQTWSGIWHGAPDRVLIRQSYPGEDDCRRHFETLTEAFHDRRYVRVDEKPLFMVYRPHDLPNADRFAELWRELARAAGLSGLYLVGRSNGQWNPVDHGFDAAVTSQVAPPFQNRLKSESWARLRPDWALGSLTRRSSVFPAIYSYRHWSRHIPWALSPGPSHPTVVPGWDNTPRSRRRGLVYHGSTPQLFGEQVRVALRLVADQPDDRRIVFVQAWNEWGEGNCLEPDARFGRGYLEELQKSVVKN